MTKKDNHHRHCVICDKKIPRELGRGISDYCSSECSDVALSARTKYNVMLRKHVNSGAMQKASCFKCVDCGKDACDYDHRNYLNPLDVVPVCRSCNILRRSADDIRNVVAEKLGICVKDVPSFMHKIHEQRDARYKMYYERVCAVLS